MTLTRLQVTQLHNKMRNADRDRERMVSAIHDLQSQVDLLQSKSDASVRSSDHENTRMVLVIRDLEAQLEDLSRRASEEQEHASKLVGEVDETNCALDEVRSGLEKEMELRKEAERENALLQKMFEDEVNQWRAKEAQWERERTEIRENGLVPLFFPLWLSISLTSITAGTRSSRISSTDFRRILRGWRWRSKRGTKRSRIEML